MEQKFFLACSPGGFHKVAYTEWGTPNQNPIICVHGLSRNGRDFDYLAQALSEQGYYVACPDIVGRGDSDWLSNPKYYDFPQYVSDMTTLIARLNCKEVDWIGTSMGGIIGMIMASFPNTPIRRLILNDVGPYIPSSSLKFIKTYLDKNPHFANFEAAEQYFKNIYTNFGDLAEEQWQQLTMHTMRQVSDGSYKLKRDPTITLSPSKARIFFKILSHPLKCLTGTLFDVDLWNLWQKVKCPTFVIRGENSTVLPKWVLPKMREINPKTQWVEIANTGHAPALMSSDQIHLIIDAIKGSSLDC